MWVFSVVASLLPLSQKSIKVTFPLLSLGLGWPARKVLAFQHYQKHKKNEAFAKVHTKVGRNISKLFLGFELNTWSAFILSAALFSVFPSCLKYVGLLKDAWSIASMLSQSLMLLNMLNWILKDAFEDSPQYTTANSESVLHCPLLESQNLCVVVILWLCCLSSKSYTRYWSGCSALLCFGMLHVVV